MSYNLGCAKLFYIELNIDNHGLTYGQMHRTYCVQMIEEYTSYVQVSSHPLIKE
jgi:hypothetical protein